MHVGCSPPALRFLPTLNLVCFHQSRVLLAHTGVSGSAVWGSVAHFHDGSGDRHETFIASPIWGVSCMVSGPGHGVLAR